MNRTKRLLISMLTLLCCCTGGWALELDGEGNYLIGSVQDWKDFAAIVNNGTNTADMLNKIRNIRPQGSTALYDCTISALNILNKESSQYSGTH